MKQLVIDRQTWLRGEGHHSSYLLRVEDGKKCCLGFYAEQLAGLSKDEITGVRAPVEFSSRAGVFGDLIKWTTNSPPKPYHSGDCDLMMTVNDRDMLESDRELALTELFRQVGVEVTFIN